jgi:hypothetical protein
MVVCAGSAEPHGQLPSAGLALAPLAPDCVTNAVACVCTTFVGIAGTSIILNKVVTVTAVGTIRTWSAVIRYVAVVIASPIGTRSTWPGSSLAVAARRRQHHRHYRHRHRLCILVAIGVAVVIAILTRVAAVAFAAAAVAIASTIGTIGTGIDVDRPRRDKLSILGMKSAQGPNQQSGSCWPSFVLPMNVPSRRLL